MDINHIEMKNKDSFSSDKTGVFLDMIQVKSLKSRPKTNPPKFFIESSKIKNTLENIKNKIVELEKIENLFTCFNSDEEKINQTTNFINDQIKESQNRINFLSNYYDDMHSNKQSEAILKCICEILQSRLVDCTQNFKKNLQKRTEVIRQMEDKKQKYQKYPSVSNNKKEKWGKNKPMFLRVDNNNSQIIDLENRNNGSTISNESTNNEDFRPVKLVEEEINPLQTRAGAMKNIESMIKETAHVFQRLGNIVKMQEVMIDRIDKDTDDALLNVEKGRKILTQTYRDVSSNRGLIIKVLIILFIFATIYIIFLL